MKSSEDRVSDSDGGKRRVVVVAPNWLGDIVMALPSISDVHRHFQSAGDAVSVAVHEGMAPVFEALPGLGSPIRLQGGRRGLNADAGVLAAGQFDVAILLPNSFRSAWVVRRGEIPERWGYRSDFRGWLLTRAVRRPSRREHRHQADYYRALVSGLGMPLGMGVDAAIPILTATDAQRDRSAVLLERHHVETDTPRVAVAPGATNGHAKRWLPERFAEVARRLVVEFGRTILLVGGPGDRGAGREIESALEGFGSTRSNGGSIVNLIGQTDLSELMGVLAGCEACVSNDTGAMHLASALGVPVVALFGPSDERATSPMGRHELLVHAVRCRPCLLRDCPIDHRCMRGISTTDVLETVSRLAGWPARGGS